jgi:hypothetical protein
MTAKEFIEQFRVISHLLSANWLDGGKSANMNSNAIIKIICRNRSGHLIQHYNRANLLYPIHPIHSRTCLKPRLI